MRIQIAATTFPLTYVLPSCTLYHRYSTVDLQEPGGKCRNHSGRIIDSQDVPVAQAHLTLLNAGGTAIAHATSDAQGGFTLQNIDPGVYQNKCGGTPIPHGCC